MVVFRSLRNMMVFRGAPNGLDCPGAGRSPSVRTFSAPLGSPTPMKKSTRIRPVVESLESMILLSTAVASVHELARRPVHVAPPVESGPVALVGTVHGAGTVVNGKISVSGSGNLGSVGLTSFRINTTLTNPTTNVTLATRRGNLYLTSTSPIIGAASGGSTTYSITGGTKYYAHASGTGVVSATYSLFKNHRLTTTIRFA